MSVEVIKEASKTAGLSSGKYKTYQSSRGLNY